MYKSIMDHLHRSISSISSKLKEILIGLELCNKRIRISVISFLMLIMLQLLVPPSTLAAPTSSLFLLEMPLKVTIELNQMDLKSLGNLIEKLRIAVQEVLPPAVADTAGTTDSDTTTTKSNSTTTGIPQTKGTGTYSTPQTNIDQPKTNDTERQQPTEFRPMPQELPIPQELQTDRNETIKERIIV